MSFVIPRTWGLVTAVCVIATSSAFAQNTGGVFGPEVVSGSRALEARESFL